MATDELAARRAALRLLAAVLGTGRMLDDADAGDDLEPSDRARAQRLAQTTLRHLGRADAILEPLLNKQTPLRTRNAMRLAIVEMAELDAPAHGAVSSAVEVLRRSQKTSRTAGVANAVLRSAAKELEHIWSELPPEKLRKWLRASLIASWGEEVVERLEIAHQAGAAIDLTPGPRMTDEIRDALPVDILPTGSLRMRSGSQITALPGFENGAFWVQDAAAALPARILNTKPGENVLDLCAAPGGKTMQLAATGAKVTAVDISKDRLERLTQNLTRTGLEASVVCADLLTWEPDRKFDAILLDAPCSATGTIRRHPDLPHVKDGSGIKELAKLQGNLIDRAVGWLSPGGRIVFATCSLLPMEGENQVRAAMEGNPGLKLDLDALNIAGVEAGWITDVGMRLRPDYWPELGGMDGFFITAFAKD